MRNFSARKRHSPGAGREPRAPPTRSSSTSSGARSRARARRCRSERPQAAPPNPASAAKARGPSDSPPIAHRPGDVRFGPRKRGDTATRCRSRSSRLRRRRCASAMLRGGARLHLELVEGGTQGGARGDARGDRRGDAALRTSSGGTFIPELARASSSRRSSHARANSRHRRARAAAERPDRDDAARRVVARGADFAPARPARRPPAPRLGRDDDRAAGAELVVTGGGGVDGARERRGGRRTAGVREAERSRDAGARRERDARARRSRGHRRSARTPRAARSSAKAARDCAAGVAPRSRRCCGPAVNLAYARSATYAATYAIPDQLNGAAAVAARPRRRRHRRRRRRRPPASAR